MPVPRPHRKKPRESRTRYVVLGMLATGGPATGYGLRQQIAGSVGHFWQESFGQIYPALRQLAAEGLVQGRAIRGGPGRPGATWQITPRGRAELARWVAQPPAIEPERNELLLKVFFAGAVPPAVTARNLEGVAAQLRGGLAGLEAIASRWEEETGGKPDAPYWRLTLDFGLTFMRTALGWIDQAQGVLRSQERRARIPFPPVRRPAARSGGYR
jgi:PadR family transcriptional regulator, regulatory protein AphA